MTKQEDMALLRAAINDLREALGGLSNFHGKPESKEWMEAVDNALRKITRVRDRV